MGVLLFILEWPLPLLAGTGIHRSLEFRLATLPLAALAAALIYQGTNAALYYLVGMLVYFWAYSEGEVYLSLFSPVIISDPNTFPRSYARSRGRCHSVVVVAREHRAF
jgi:hypothetical protein